MPGQVVIAAYLGALPGIILGMCVLITPMGQLVSTAIAMLGALGSAVWEYRRERHAT